MPPPPRPHHGRPPAAAPPTRRAPWHAKGFLLTSEEGATYTCRDVRGFREALLAAAGAGAPAPRSLVLVVPDLALGDWLEAWGSDLARVERSLVITRCVDGKGITARATLAAHGFGVDTALAVDGLAPLAPPVSPARARPRVRPR